MTFKETAIAGLYLVELTPVLDERGFFAVAFEAKEFAARGLDTQVAQVSVSFNRSRGTLRGMHYQQEPAAEVKLVRCTHGAVYDVAVDLRPGSPTHLQWVATELTAENRLAIYIPKGCAHGFQTLQDDCEVFYQVSHEYAPAMARGLRYDDPAIGITWPLPATVMSERDREWPLLPARDAAR